MRPSSETVKWVDGSIKGREKFYNLLKKKNIWKKFPWMKVLGVAMLLVGMVIFVLVAVLLHKKENGEEGFNEIRLDWLQRPSGPWT